MNETIEETRRIRSEQDRLYEESLCMDQDKYKKRHRMEVRLNCDLDVNLCMALETCPNDHLNAATTSLHGPETTVPTDWSLKETVTGPSYGGHLSTADYGHYAAPLLIYMLMLPSLVPRPHPKKREKGLVTLGAKSGSSIM